MERWHEPWREAHLCPYCVSLDLETAASTALSCVEMTCSACHINLRVFVGVDTLSGGFAEHFVASAFPND
ncbi:MAG TPA: hypothetical protein VFI11_05155 [Anaerolineales bacterium]|nr:hypothetical protein [Anaerolineales bacterium]